MQTPFVSGEEEARGQAAACNLGNWGRSLPWQCLERHRALPAAWLLPDFSPGLYGETSLGPVTNGRNGDQQEHPSWGAQELCALMTAAPSQDWQRLCFTFSCLSGNCFPHPMASGRPCGDLLPQFASLLRFAPLYAQGAVGEQLPIALQAFGVQGPVLKSCGSDRPRSRLQGGSDTGLLPKAEVHPPFGLHKALRRLGLCPSLQRAQRELQGSPQLQVFWACFF